MKFAVVGSAGMTDIEIEGYILPETERIYTNGKNTIGALAKEYANRRKIPCEIIADAKELLENVDAIVMFWEKLDEEAKEYVRLCDEIGVPNTVFCGRNLTVIR